MKRYALITVLMAMLVPVTALCQEPLEGEKPPPVNPEHQIRVRRMQLELEKREAELDFEREMRELELGKRRIELAHKQKEQEHRSGFRHHKKCMFPLFVICFIVHILVAVWVYQDIRKRNRGSGIWIVVALLTGLFGVLVYAVVRLGDIRKTEG